MTLRTIYIQGKRYNFFDIYSTREKALAIAHKYKEKTKSQYFILETEEGFFAPRKAFRLYLTRVWRLG